MDLGHGIAGGRRQAQGAVGGSLTKISARPAHNARTRQLISTAYSYSLRSVVL